MRTTTHPLIAAVVSGFLLIAGLYMALRGSGTAALLGWMFTVVAVLGIVGNIALHRKTRQERPWR